MGYNIQEYKNRNKHNVIIIIRLGYNSLKLKLLNYLVYRIAQMHVIAYIMVYYSI